jgi:hypothetical protein
MLIKRLLIALPLILLQQTTTIPVTPVPGEHLCWNYAQAAPPDQTFEEFIEDVGEEEGIYTQFRPNGTDNVDFRRLDNGFLGGTHGVADDQSVDLLLQLYTAEPGPLHVRYLLIRNEQQVSVPIDGELVPYFDVMLVGGEMQTYILPLGTLDAGIHDIALLALQDFDIPPEPTGSISGSSFRLSLIAGALTAGEETNIPNGYDTLPFIEYPASEEPASPQFPNYPIELRLNEDTRVQWSYPDPVLTLPRRAPLSFYALGGYANVNRGEEAPSDLELPPYSHFALLAFINYEQVPITEEQPVIYGMAPIDRLFTWIPITLDAPDELGLHELLMVRVNSPRVPMCTLIGPPDGLFINPQVTHNRAAFEVVAADE